MSKLHPVSDAFDEANIAPNHDIDLYKYETFVKWILSDLHQLSQNAYFFFNIGLVDIWIILLLIRTVDYLYIKLFSPLG